METSSDNNDEDTLELASKTWSRVIDSAAKTGFREGIKDGSTSVFQEGFDKGYKDAFKSSFLVGAYKGLAVCLAKDKLQTSEIESILSKNKKGICKLCELEADESNNLNEKSITEIQSLQNDYSQKSIQILKDHFDPTLKEHNIDFELLKAYT